jgi:hypothetical protein
MSALFRLRSRIVDALWERHYRRNPAPPMRPERATRLLARVDQALAANRDKHPFIVCDDPDCKPYGEHFQRLHGPAGNGPSPATEEQP